VVFVDVQLRDSTKQRLTPSLMIAISAAVMDRKAASGRKMESFILRIDWRGIRVRN
jgi:hypothetical protein